MALLLVSLVHMSYEVSAQNQGTFSSGLPLYPILLLLILITPPFDLMI
jgi:hypothetical protein